MSRWTLERRLLAASVVAWVVTAIVNLVTDPSLGYDESAFATVARGDDTPNWLYRSRGVTTLAQLGIALGGGEWALRLPFVVIGLGLPLAVYALGRAAFDARTGAWAAAVIATGHQMLGRNAHVLGDVPSALGVVAGLAIVVGELSREEGPRRRLLLAAPAFAFAFYMRYGSAPVIAIAAVLGPLVWFRTARRSPGIVFATGALLALLLVPHVVHSLAQTDSVLGVLRFSAGVPRREYVGEGLVTYVTSNPFRYYGLLVAPCLVAGLAGIVLRRRAPAYLVAVAVAQIVIIGLQSHAQPRYVFVAVAILVVVGVGAISAVMPRASPRITLVVLAATWLWSTRWIVRTNTKLTETRESIVAAADAIRRDANGPCIVLATSLPQVLWYSGCRTGRWYYDLDEGALSPARRRYLVETPAGYPVDPQWAIDHAVKLRELPTGHAKSRVWRVD